MNVRQAAPAEVLDVGNTLVRFGGDKALFLEMTAILLEDAPRLANELRTALRAGDAKGVEMKAHALRGLVAGSGGMRAAQVAHKLEEAGHRGNLGDAPSKMDSLDLELQALTEAIRAYHRTNSPA